MRGFTYDCNRNILVTLFHMEEANIMYNKLSSHFQNVVTKPAYRKEYVHKMSEICCLKTA